MILEVIAIKACFARTTVVIGRFCKECFYLHFLWLSFPELETEVVEGSQKGSYETTSPEP